MGRDILVDGYNIIKRAPSFQAARQQNLATARAQLITLLINRYRYTPHQVIIVFDGDEPLEQVSYERRIRIIYSRLGETADTVIARLIAQARAAGREVEIYSDDSEIRHSPTDLGGQYNSMAGGTDRPDFLSKPIEIFMSYTRKDERFRRELLAHLSLLVHQGIISIWYEREISAGAEWRQEIDAHINSAQIILILVSPDFVASDYADEREMTQALERHERGDARVVPIILRPVDWHSMAFGKLQPLPRDGKPVTQWVDRDAAFVDIARSIRLICKELLIPNTHVITKIGEPEDQPTYELRKVFVKSGVPSVTFVERTDFRLLKDALAHPNRGMVIEGPSGIGKTTALKKAIEELGLHKKEETRPVMLTARNPEDRDRIQTLRRWHHGTVIIDDFHRLDLVLRKEIVDFLKELADKERAPYPYR